MIKQFTALLSLLLLLTIATVEAQSPKGPKAPEWDIAEWLNGDAVTLESLKGKVVVVEFFQLWCPGCNQFSIPLMKEWHHTFADEIESGQLVMLSIHTVFEGHFMQSPSRLKSFIKEKGITHRVGIDRHIDDHDTPETMRRYRTRGTPEMAFIDKTGHIRVQQFGSFDPQKGEALVRQLLGESS